ncbi:MAG: hypothetical protein ABSG93_15885 [Solirubrobacteraceae bacterium]|jgi:hypothetical protein
MTADYEDPRIVCSADGLRISGYYVPWGSKRIPYEAIRSIRRVNTGMLTGRARLWGTANPRYWANLDLQRPRKKVGFILDTGHRVRPFLTPDDPNAFEAALTAHRDIAVEQGGRGVVI